MLDNNQMILGINDKKRKSLIMEDLTSKHGTSTSYFGSHIYNILSILSFPEMDTLLVNDSSNKLIQYQRDSRGSWKVGKHYEHLRIG